MIKTGECWDANTFHNNFLGQENYCELSPQKAKLKTSPWSPVHALTWGHDYKVCD